MLSRKDVESYQRDGYLPGRRLLSPTEAERKPVSQNPLELSAAGIFAAMFVVTSLLSTWVKAEFGLTGIYSLAAVVGVTDIDPFVLNLAQGGTSGIPKRLLF